MILSRSSRIACAASRSLHSTNGTPAAPASARCGLARSEVIAHRWPLEGCELALVESLYRLSNNTRESCVHCDSCGLESSMRIWPAVASEHGLRALADNDLRGLNARASARSGIRVLNGFDVEGIGVDDEEVVRATEARVDLGLERGSQTGYGYLHGIPLCPFSKQGGEPKASLVEEAEDPFRT